MTKAEKFLKRFYSGIVLKRYQIDLIIQNSILKTWYEGCFEI